MLSHVLPEWSAAAGGWHVLALMCTTSRQIPASASTNQGSDKGDSMTPGRCFRTCYTNGAP